MFQVNQIVKGKVCGTFVILGFREIAGEQFVQVKEVNPQNFNETCPGELALSLDSIKEIS